MALTINGECINDEEFQQAKEQLFRQQAGMDGPPEWEIKGMGIDEFAKQMVVAKVLIRQEAKQNGPEIPRGQVTAELKKIRDQFSNEHEFRKHLEESGLSEKALRESIELNLKVDQLLDTICAVVPEPTDEEAQEHYEANKEAFKIPERLHAAHIVKHCQGGTILDIQAALSEMNEVHEQLQQGVDFAILARQHSECPDSGGDLGWFSRGAMVPEFEEVVFALEEGQVSGVFETPFGFHIARLLERLPAEERPFEEVVNDVKLALYNDRENAAIDTFTLGLKEKATIEEE